MPVRERRFRGHIARLPHLGTYARIATKPDSSRSRRRLASTRNQSCDLPLCEGKAGRRRRRPRAPYNRHRLAFRCRSRCAAVRSGAPSPLPRFDQGPLPRLLVRSRRSAVGYIRRRGLTTRTQLLRAQERLPWTPPIEQAETGYGKQTPRTCSTARNGGRQVE